jgi:hypothetical protein
MALRISQLTCMYSTAATLPLVRLPLQVSQPLPS